MVATVTVATVYADEKLMYSIHMHTCTITIVMETQLIPCMHMHIIICCSNVKFSFSLSHAAILIHSHA